jgi:hypothetical protein
METKYRRVTDRYCGYEVQRLVGFWIFKRWVQVGFTNTSISIEHAKQLIREDKEKRAWKSKEVWPNDEEYARLLERQKALSHASSIIGKLPKKDE